MSRLLRPPRRRAAGSDRRCIVRARGMTLLELLVSIAVGLVLLGMTVWIAAGVVRLVRNLIASLS
ncbi:MAG: prepilin-type N-terminal cleavage/methylation domain-containing protein [Planctomyces sp.]